DDGDLAVEKSCGHRVSVHHRTTNCGTLAPSNDIGGPAHGAEICVSQEVMMKVAVFGATGMVGSAIVAEGRSRGHEVITVSSRNGAADRVADVTQPGQVRGIAEDVDVVVISVPPP